MKPFHIIGGGLAGLLIAQRLKDLGFGPITVAENSQPMRASDAPVAICHPFPGRSVQPHPLLDAAYAETIQWMRRWRSWQESLVKELPILRPKSAGGFDRLVRSWKREWSTKQPPWGSIRLDATGLIYGPCFAVQLGALCAHWRSRLQKEDVQFIPAVPNDWFTSSTHTLIICAGRSLKDWFPSIGLISEGGELGQYRSQQPLTSLVSGGGFHMGPKGPFEIVVGSTRWTDQPKTEPDHVLPALGAAARALWPETGDPISAWRGVRSIFPKDRLPIAGPVPNRQNTWVLGALGSKGLLWGPYSAECLVQEMTGHNPVHTLLSTRRIDVDKWGFHTPDSL